MMAKTDRRCACGHAESEHNETWVPCRGYSIHTSCKCEGFYPVCKIEEHRGPNKTLHPEAICEECGGPNVTWFTVSDLWNKVARRPDGSDPMLCPVCFIIHAERMGINKSAWEIKPEGRGPDEEV